MLLVNMPEAYKIEYLDVPVPEVGDDQVLIKMKRVGICGSDIQVYHGRHKYMTFPIVQGHEGSGVVDKIGKNVKNFSVGDRVTVQPQLFCEKCYPCKTGSYNVCENLKVLGVHASGMAVEYFLVDASKVLKLPENMDFDKGALVEPIAVGVHAAKKCGEIKGANIVVLGAGPIGNLVAQAAKAFGAAKVMITDINQKKLDKAAKCGIDYCINTKDISLKDAIAQCFGDRRADAIVDCAAVKASISQAIQSARNCSRIVVVGNFKEPVEIEMPLLQRREIDMIGVMMYTRCDYEDAIRFLAEGKILTEELITDYFDIREFKQAYEHIDAHVDDVMKVMLKID